MIDDPKHDKESAKKRLLSLKIPNAEEVQEAQTTFHSSLTEALEKLGYDPTAKDPTERAKEMSDFVALLNQYTTQRVAPYSTVTLNAWWEGAFLPDETVLNFLESQLRDIGEETLADTLGTAATDAYTNPHATGNMLQHTLADALGVQIKDLNNGIAEHTSVPSVSVRHYLTASWGSRAIKEDFFRGLEIFLREENWEPKEIDTLKSLYEQAHALQPKTKKNIYKGELSYNANALWKQIKNASQGTENTPSHLTSLESLADYLAEEYHLAGKMSNPNMHGQHPNQPLKPLTNAALHGKLVGKSSLSLPLLTALETLAQQHGIEHPSLYRLLDQECRDTADRFWQESAEQENPKERLGLQLKAIRLRMGGLDLKMMGKAIAPFAEDKTKFSNGTISYWETGRAIANSEAGDTSPISAYATLVRQWEEQLYTLAGEEEPPQPWVDDAKWDTLTRSFRDSINSLKKDWSRPIPDTAPWEKDATEPDISQTASGFRDTDQVGLGALLRDAHQPKINQVTECFSSKHAPNGRA